MNYSYILDNLFVDKTVIIIVEEVIIQSLFANTLYVHL